MITLLRTLRLWQLKTKWKLAFWQFIDKQSTDLMKHPEELEKKFISEIAKIIHQNDTLDESDK